MTTATLLTLIGNSAATARTIGWIAEHAGVPRREVEQAIQTARIEGVPLVTGEHGVWATDSPAEASQMAERLRYRIVHQYVTYRALRATARRMAAQHVEQTAIPWESAA